MRLQLALKFRIIPNTYLIPTLSFITQAETINQAENPAPEYEPVSNVAGDQAQAAEVLPQAGSPDAKSGVLEASSDWAVEGATGAGP